MIVPRPYWSC